MSSRIIIYLILIIFVFIPDISNARESGECGESGNAMRIVGGQNAPPHIYPWMALLEIRFKTSRGSLSSDRCGGSLINNRWVLTAAHCFDEDESAKLDSVLITLGEYDTETLDGQEVFLHDTKVIIHEHYDNNIFKNDMALVRLNITLNFNGKHKHLMPICLPKEQKYVNGTCQVSGWGHTKNAGQTSKILKTAKMPILPVKDCLRLWSAKEFFPKNHICAGYESGGKDSCQGDSGGPLACRKSKNIWAQYGLVSFGEECAKAGKPGIYTRIVNYLSWIEKNIKKNS